MGRGLLLRHAARRGARVLGGVFRPDKVQDAHARSRCRDLNGTEPWACGDCDCSARLEAPPCRRRARIFALGSIYSCRAILAAGAAGARRRGARARPRQRGRADARAGRCARRRCTRDDELAVRVDARRSVAAPGRSRSGRRGARPPARHLPRHGLVRPAVDALAAARPARVGARRSVARHRAPRPRAEAGGSRARLARASASPTTSSASAIARSATSRSSASTSPRRRPRCTPPAIAVISRSSTRSRASRSRSSAATTKRWRALRQAERLASLVHADDVLATVCGNQANVMMMRAPLRAGARAGRAQRRRCTKRTAPATASPSRWRRSARSACASAISARAEEALHRALDVRSPIQFHETTGAVFDTLAQIHLIRGALRHGERISRRAPARRTARTGGRRASGTSGRCACSAPGWRSGAARSTRPSARADEILAGRRAAVRCAAGDAHRRRGADRRRAARRSRAAARHAPPTRSIPKIAPAAWGEYLRLRGALHAKTAAPPTRTTTSRRARRCSICSASAIRRRSATSRSAASSPQTGARSIAERHLESGARRLRAARRRARSRRHARRAAAADDGRLRRIRASRRPMPTMRSCGGSWTRRRCPICSAAKRPPRCSRPPRPTARWSSSSSPGGDVRVIASAGCEPDAARALARSASHGQPRTAAARSSSSRSGRDRRPALRAWSRRRGRSATRCCGACA